MKNVKNYNIIGATMPSIEIFGYMPPELRSIGEPYWIRDDSMCGRKASFATPRGTLEVRDIRNGAMLRPLLYLEPESGLENGDVFLFDGKRFMVFGREEDDRVLKAICLQGLRNTVFDTEKPLYERSFAKSCIEAWYANGLLMS